MLSVPCPKCGGTNIFDETKQIPTYCSFCGAHLPDMTEYVRRSLNLGVDRQYFNMNMQQMDRSIDYVNADTHRINRQIRRERVKNFKNVVLLIALLIIFGMTMIAVLVYFRS